MKTCGNCGVTIKLVKNYGSELKDQWMHQKIKGTGLFGGSWGKDFDGCTSPEPKVTP